MVHGRGPRPPTPVRVPIPTIQIRRPCWWRKENERSVSAPGEPHHRDNAGTTTTDEDEEDEAEEDEGEDNGEDGDDDDAYAIRPRGISRPRQVEDNL